jgi:DNA-directed RNA polymerase sigma subunit (sigma70/sigma32)
MHHIWQAVKAAERAVSRLESQVSLDHAMFSASESADPATAWEARTVSSAVWELVNRLPEELRIVVVARYGLTGAGRAIYPRIGAVLGLSAERARQLHTEALLWLSQPAHSQALRSLLGRHTLADYEAVEAETQRWLQWRGKRHGR